jgi:hypothetical protein
MKVFNITDASTAALRNQGLENQHIKVGDVIVAPGASTVLRGTAKERSELSSLIKAGAVVVGKLPVWYAAKRNLSLDGTPFVVSEPVAQVVEADNPPPESAPESASVAPESSTEE